MTKEFGHYLLSLNNIYILYILSLWHSLPSAAAIGVSPPKSGYGEERRHGGELFRFIGQYADGLIKLGKDFLEARV